MNTKLYHYLKDQYNRGSTGHVSDLKGRFAESPLPWQFKHIVKRFCADCLHTQPEADDGASSALDLSAESGGVFEKISGLPKKLYAVSRCDPVKLPAEKRLQGGVTLRPVKEDGVLPFDSGIFDLVSNQNGKYHLSEVKRVLKPGGIYITQQYGALTASDLCCALGIKPPASSRRCLVQNIGYLNKEGFEILQKEEWIGKNRFYDPGAVLYYMRCLSWCVPRFDFDAYFPQLEILAEIIEDKGCIDSIEHCFYVVARKGA